MRRALLTFCLTGCVLWLVGCSTRVEEAPSAAPLPTLPPMESSVPLPSATVGSGQTPSPEMAVVLEERRAAAEAAAARRRATAPQPPEAEAEGRQAKPEDVDLPLYPGATLEQSKATVLQRLSATVYGKTADAPVKVLAWYKANLKGGPWTEVSALGGANPSASLSQADKSGLRQVTITVQNGSTRVMLMRIKATPSEQP